MKNGYTWIEVFHFGGALSPVSVFSLDVVSLVCDTKKIRWASIFLFLITVDEFCTLIVKVLCNGEVLEKVFGDLKGSTKKFDKEIEECQKLRKKLEGRVVKAIPATAGFETDASASRSYGDLDLRTVPGSTHSKYALILLNLMFTETELITQMCKGTKSGRRIGHISMSIKLK